MEVGITVTDDEEEVVSLAASNFVSNTSSSTKSNAEATVEENRFDFDEPANWPNVIDDATQVALVTKCTVRITEYDFPKNEVQNNRRFKKTYYKRKLKNGKEVEKTWLVYSKNNDAIYFIFVSYFQTTRLR